MGQGERRLFRVIMKNLAVTKPEIVLKNIKHFPDFGRWDDVVELIDSSSVVSQAALDMIKTQLSSDMNSDTPSLLAKWLPSENASSKETTRKALIVIQYLDIPPRIYRKVLTKLRNKIKIIETKLTEKKYSEIDYSQVPSNANKKYHKAFWRNDECRYSEYLQKLVKGDKTVKINTKTLYPYDIVRDIINNTDYGFSWSKGRLYEVKDAQKDLSLDVMWKNLPDYINGSMGNAIAVIDTSGSMTMNDNLPISIAVSMGIYFAERYNGPFANTFISFSDKPQLHKIEGTDIATQVRSIMEKEEIANTNIKAVFDLILQIAVNNKLNQSELPDQIIIVTDLNFDSATSGINNDTNRLFDYIKASWNIAGYKIPALTFWNVDARNEAFPMTIDDEGVKFVSGCSPVLFKSILSNQLVTPLQMVLNTVDVDRYRAITV